MAFDTDYLVRHLKCTNNTSVDYRCHSYDPTSILWIPGMFKWFSKQPCGFRPELQDEYGQLKRQTLPHLRH